MTTSGNVKDLKTVNSISQNTCSEAKVSSGEYSQYVLLAQQHITNKHVIHSVTKTIFYNTKKYKAHKTSIGWFHIWQ